MPSERENRLKRQLEDQAERHRDAYNQALGGLHVLEQLAKPDDSFGVTNMAKDGDGKHGE